MNNFNVNKFFYYDELSQEAQAQARINVLVPEYEAKARNIAQALQTWKDNKNKAINDPSHIRRLINGSAALRKVKAQGDKYLIPYIRQNVTIFTNNGEYVYYIKDCVGIVSKGKRYKLNGNDVKQLAIQAYIDVNDRGPAYHRWLYNMHHKIKHFMIRQ